MECFDDIPEDRCPSYGCDCSGNITQNIVSGNWECDRCDKKIGGDAE